MPYSILEITDGSIQNTVSFITRDVGLNLKTWDPAINQFKNDGVWQDNSQVAGRRLVQSQFANAIETFTFTLNGRGQDDLIRELVRLIELLLRAISYWQTEKGDPIYIKAKSPCETGIRYCEVRGFSIPGLKNPYAAPFFVAQELAAMDEIELTIERLFWLANPPGEGECLPINSLQVWQAGQSILDTNLGDPSVFYDMVEAANGDLFIADAGDNEVWKSTDGGLSWSVVALGGTSTLGYFIRRISNGYLFVSGNQNLYRSTNDGGAWSTVFFPSGASFAWGFAEYTAGGKLFYSDVSNIYSSTDNGATWSVSPIINLIAGIWEIFVDSNDSIFAVAGVRIFRSQDGGTSWHIVYDGTAYGQGGRMVETANGLFVAFDGAILKSTDGGNTWEPVFLTGYSSRVGSFYNLHFVKVDDSTLYASYSAGVLASFDGGATWSQVFTSTSGYGTFILYVDSGSNVYIGEWTAGPLNNLWLRDDSSTDFGASVTTCDDPPEVYTVNKYSPTQITHVKISDGGVFTDLMPMTAFPVTLFPATPATNDALYFISSTNIANTGQFDNLVLYLTENLGYLTGGALSVFTWEYWNGAAWATLTVADGTAQFSRLGVSSVHWIPPSDWATTTVNGVTGWIVRVRISSSSASITPPEQGVRAIYTANNPYIEISGEDVAGDISALLRCLLYNQSDRDGRGGNAPNLWDNRIIAGLRSFEESSFFQAFLNISDRQLPYGVSVAVGSGATSFVSDNEAPTGRRITYNPAGVETMATRATITLAPAVARDFYGSFHVFLRAKRTAGNATDISIQLQIVTGSGGIIKTTEIRQLQTTTAWELLDFGQIDLPVSGDIKDDELPDSVQILIQASAASGTPDLYLYDLILMPVDEWAIDAVDFSNSTASIVGVVNSGIKRLLDIDSVVYPILDIRCLIRRDNEDGLIVGTYNPITNGEAIAQVGLAQRLWILCAQTSATGSSYSWIAPPDISHSVQAFKNERYLALRGDR